MRQDQYLGNLLERDALLLADILEDEGVGHGEVDPGAIRHLVYEAGGFVTPLRRAYDEVFLRWSNGGSSRDRRACQLLSHAHVAAASTRGDDSTGGGGDGMPASGMFVDWSHDERPIWRTSIHYRCAEWDDTGLPPQAAARVTSELRKTGLTRYVHVAIDADEAGYELAFNLHATDQAEAEAAAQRLAGFCLDRAGMPFARSISRRRTGPGATLP